ncbi:MAG: hypothetical protein OEM81_06780 [Acidimicrobiia bacterium]|nr:hypothetical protein [Acidimicrobiia bacterium]MDH3397526.1 hypothetical protein [Acidimicrobiia bacterium]
MSETVEFEKSAWKVWLLALLGVPFLLIGVDFFFAQKLFGVFRDLIYGTEELPAFEPRDTIIAALFIIGGAVLTLWGLKELVFPKKVFVADHEGIRLAVNGPFRPAVLVPWELLTDVGYEVINDEGDLCPSIRVEVADRTGLPDHPWGARWVGSNELLIDTAGWSPPASDIVDSLVRLRQSVDVEASAE